MARGEALDHCIRARKLGAEFAVQPAGLCEAEELAFACHRQRGFLLAERGLKLVKHVVERPVEGFVRRARPDASDASFELAGGDFLAQGGQACGLATLAGA